MLGLSDVRRELPTAAPPSLLLAKRRKSSSRTNTRAKDGHLEATWEESELQNRREAKRRKTQGTTDGGWRQMRDLVWSPADRIPGRMEGDSLAGASSTGTVKCPGRASGWKRRRRQLQLDAADPLGRLTRLRLRARRERASGKPLTALSPVFPTGESLFSQSVQNQRRSCSCSNVQVKTESS